jgi:uncharacterized membrane protein YkvA (DUF1232 family)
MRSVNSSTEFLRRMSRQRPSAKKNAASIQEYVEESASSLTQEDLEKLRAKLPLLKVRFAGIEAPEFPHLRQQLDFLADFFEDTCDGFFPAASEELRKQSAFALIYAIKEADIIPDSIPEIGYADDSLIARIVLTQNQDVFRDYCRFRKIRWSKSFIIP